MEKCFGRVGSWTEHPEVYDGTSSGDFLEDPEMWRDRLPQPFRMIDRLLDDLLSRTWEEIESRRHKGSETTTKADTLGSVDLTSYLPLSIMEPSKDTSEAESEPCNLIDNLLLQLTEFNNKL